MKRRVLVDLNVILDVLLDREPHVQASAAVWALVEGGQVEGRVAAHCVTTLHYLAQKARGREFAAECVSSVLTVFPVAPEDGAILRAALALGWSDFEDAACSAAADADSCHFIVTRNPKHFRGSGCPALSPVEAVAALGVVTT